MDLAKELEVAKKAACLAGQAILKYYRQPIDVEHKSPEQPITVADREANEIIAATILEAFPDDGWLSEETSDEPSRLTKERVWIVDPLDGTKEFIAHIGEFAVSIGLAIRGKPTVGVLHNPVTGELFWGSQNHGAFRNGQTIRTSSQSHLQKATILASRSEMNRGEWDGFTGKFQIRIMGSVAYKLALVAQGAADATFTLAPKSEWDICAGVVIVQEAGGIATLIDGQDIPFNQASPKYQSLIVGNAALHRPLIQLIAEHKK